MSNPFDLDREDTYRAWRAVKLAAYPATPERLRVPLIDPERPSQTELAEIRQRIAAYNMALVEVEPARVEPEAILALGRALGLHRTDANLWADTSAVSRIEAVGEDAGSMRGRADFIPYTTKPLSWHTDGYYNAADAQIGAWSLFCARPARQGGTNGLLDHEIAYLLLRDEDPAHIAALSHPEAMTIPAHVVDGQTLRPASVGPVFATRHGRLHMRYTARARNIQWRDDPATQAARAALDRLYSRATVFTFELRMKAGQGLIANNVIHCRSGFEDGDTPAARRLLYRVRYLDRIETLGD